MKITVALALTVLALFVTLGLHGAQAQEPVGHGGLRRQEREEREEEPMAIDLSIGDRTFRVRLEQNEAARELAAMVAQEPLTLQMRDYGGFEKTASLGRPLSSQDQSMMAQPGDVMLYQGQQIVIFYGSNRWSYTKLGAVEDLTGWAQTLGERTVRVTFSIGE